jgi:hypothetical protein
MKVFVVFARRAGVRKKRWVELALGQGIERGVVRVGVLSMGLAVG